MRTRPNADQWRAIREKVGLTQRDVSDALGYSTPQFISNVERGRCSFPVEQLPKLKKLYKMSTDQILDMMMKEERAYLQKNLKLK
jgi:transcriptional regulator with XRE-family HTH domain